MPCFVDPTTLTHEERTGYSKEEYDAMHRLACDRCKELESKGAVPEWAMGWWYKHKIRDAALREQNERARHAEEVRQAALEKLTKEERDELGV